MLRIKFLLFICMIAVNTTAAEYSTPMEGFIGYRNDVDVEDAFYGFTASKYYKYVSFNTIISGSTNSEYSKTDDNIIKSLTATFHASLSDVDMHYTVGKLVIPLGLYESQRVYPNAFANRTMNDSFMSRLYKDYLKTSSTGHMLEMERGNFSLQLGQYVPFDETMNMRVGSTPPKTHLKNILAGDLLSPNIVSRVEDETTITGDVDREILFTSVIYDNRSTLILDFEYVTIENSLHVYDAIQQYKDTVVQLGIELNLIDNMTNTIELQRLSSTSTGAAQNAIAFGASYDLRSVVLHAGTIIRDGPLASVSESSAGFSFIPFNNTHFRVMYRTVKGEYIPYRSLYLLNQNCPDGVCEVDSTDIEDDINIPVDMRGIEFRAVRYF